MTEKNNKNVEEVIESTSDRNFRVVVQVIILSMFICFSFLTFIVFNFLSLDLNSMNIQKDNELLEEVLKTNNKLNEQDKKIVLNSMLGDYNIINYDEVITSNYKPINDSNIELNSNLVATKPVILDKYVVEELDTHMNIITDSKTYIIYHDGLQKQLKSIKDKEKIELTVSTYFVNNLYFDAVDDIKMYSER